MKLRQVLFGFTGRISRSQYWLGTLMVIVGVLVTFFVLGLIATSLSLRFETFAIVGAVAAFLIVIIPLVAIGLKRLHDRGKGGWWLAFFYLGPTLLQGMTGALAYAGYETAAGILVLATFVIALWQIVELGFLRGTIGPNRFGEDPLGAH